MPDEEITNAQDLIDSRDVIARIEALAEEDDRGPDEDDELEALKALAKAGEDYAEDWQYGATLIRDSYFQEYAEELAEDIGAINKQAAWPLSFIDWDAAAEALKQDYTEVTFDGVSYYVR